MNAFGQRHMEFPTGRPANHRRRRGIYLIPAALTVGNMLSGFYAIFSILIGGAESADLAARAIGIAILFDSFDGTVARLTGTSSDFGKQFDSLADVISFGLAPAALAFAWGVRQLPLDTAIAQHIHDLGWWVCFALLLCSAWRLARFNVHGMAPGGSRYFIGMPTPAAAGLVAATVHAVQTPLQDWRWSLAWLFLVVSVAALMTSTVRHYSFKDIPWTRRQPSLAIVLIGLLVWSIVVYSRAVLILIAGAYALSGITLHLVRLLRHRLASHPAHTS